MHQKVTIHARLVHARFVIVLLAGFMWSLWAAHPAHAQDIPTVFTDPRSGPAGEFVSLQGMGFVPGNYEGIVFWDGAPLTPIKIPDGGRIDTSIRIPPSATKGEYTIRVCAAFRSNETGELTCFTGEFEQADETPFLVTDEVPIRLCKEDVNDCSGFGGATVYNATSGEKFETDGDGYLVGRDRFASGDLIWALAPNSTTRDYTVNFTSGPPVAVEQLAFSPEFRELRLALTLDAPLLVYDLTVAAQWHVEGDPAYAARLATDFAAASGYLYDFTGGQMALGQITVFQELEQWDQVDVHLYANNVLRPNAVVGGIVSTYTTDLDPVIDIVYEPGTVDMGSQWNRYGVPPGQVVNDSDQLVDTAKLVDDWSMAFAHELGHYLLYLYDTYRDVQGNDSAAVAAQCTGSAMSDVYRPENHAFISAPDLWKRDCGGTEAYAMLNGRTEWSTILLWYDWLLTPDAPLATEQLPVNLTEVTFVTPSQTPGPAYLPGVVDLAYQDNENSSGEARAFTYRNDRIYEQGKPIKEVNQVALTGAQVGDLLCVYDVNDYTEESGDTPRHQFGCETLQLGDSSMDMRKDSTWRPVVTLHQVATDTLRMTVTQVLSAAPTAGLTARIFPEHETGLPPVPVAPVTDADWGYDFTFAGPIPPLYVQLYVDETPAAPLTRRETVLDRGTGGGGLFGPVRKFGGVLVYSSDGKATYQRDGDLELAAGESISWQSMAGTPPLPLDKRISGQSYRLDAYPASLVISGTVQLEFQEIGDDVVASHTQAQEDPTVHFFDGQSWRLLATEIRDPASGAPAVKIATAPSQGVGVYAVLYTREVNRAWLPLLQGP
ncbi:MAG: hypothetical protein KDD78_13580 [Caldilineaceae bacterium]|nr:hypothetical protein [Caldilineaceae bacterium]